MKVGERHRQQRDPREPEREAGTNIAQPVNAEVEAGEANGDDQYRYPGIEREPRRRRQSPAQQKRKKPVEHHGGGRVAAGERQRLDAAVNLSRAFPRQQPLQQDNRETGGNRSPHPVPERRPVTPPRQPERNGYHQRSGNPGTAEIRDRHHQQVDRRRPQTLQRLEQREVHSHHRVLFGHLVDELEQHRGGRPQREPGSDEHRQLGRVSRQPRAQPRQSLLRPAREGELLSPPHQAVAPAQPGQQRAQQQVREQR